MKFLINPNKFNQLADIIIKPVFYLSMVTLAIGLIFALFLSPNDYQQGLTVRIMYVHVPSAWLALLTFAIMTIYSIIALAFKIPFGFIVITLSFIIILFAIRNITIILIKNMRKSSIITIYIYICYILFVSLYYKNLIYFCYLKSIT